MLSAVSRILQREGFDVLSAEGPRQALEIVTTPPPVDLVVSDISMPEKLGTQLVREVAQVSPQTACVLMTGGIIDSADVPIGVPVLTKPFLKQNLISVIQATLRRLVTERADLRRACEESADLRQQGRQVRVAAAEVARQTRDILKGEVEVARSMACCEIKRQLAEQFAIAARLYADSVALAPRDGDRITREKYDRLRAAAEEARWRAERVGVLFGKHVASHQCGRLS
jgi:DNA-binding response OmpR family regulator